MPAPPNAFIFDDPMDPTDNIDFLVDFSKRLQVGESIQSYTLTMSAEGTTYGLTIGTAGYAPAVVALQSLQFWLTVNVGLRTNVIYDGAGVSLPIEVTITTNSTPSRTIQRTVVVKVAHQ